MIITLKGLLLSIITLQQPSNYNYSIAALISKHSYGVVLAPAPPATKIHLLHHVISLYVIIKMATPHAQAHGLVKDENPYYFQYWIFYINE